MVLEYFMDLQNMTFKRPGPEDLTDFPVEKELGGLPHLFSPKWGNQLSSVLLVHGLGRVLAAGS